MLTQCVIRVFDFIAVDVKRARGAQRRTFWLSVTTQVATFTERLDLPTSRRAMPRQRRRCPARVPRLKRARYVAGLACGLGVAFVGAEVM